MPRKIFVAGEILTASDVNTNLMDQSVMVFDDATARATAIPTPVEGMVTYLSDEDEVQVFDGSAFKAVGPGKILQVVSTPKTDTFSMSSSTFSDVTGLSATITPTSNTSKILVTYNVQGNGRSGVTSFFARLLRNSTVISVGDAAGDRSRVSGHILAASSFAMHFTGGTFLDSPNTASAVTYKIQVASSVSGNPVHVNRANDDGDTLTVPRGVSSITLMEVAG